MNLEGNQCNDCIHAHDLDIKNRIDVTAILTYFAVVNQRLQRWLDFIINNKNGTKQRW